jgi:hypothetical protein
LAQTSSNQESKETRKRSNQTRNRWLAAIAVVLGIFVVAFAITAEYVARHAGPLLRSSVVATLTTRFHSPVELDSLDISVAKGLQVHGRGLRIFYLAGPTQPDLKQKQGLPAPPMLSVNNFTFRTTLDDLLHLHANIARVDVDGMELHIPPHTGGHVLHITPPKTRITISVAKIYCKNVKLVIETAKPDKAPLQFDIQNLELTDVGGGQPMLYVANVINPKPIGDVYASGHFGPWQSDNPRITPLDGHYTFTHADLGSIKGLGGILSSTGQFDGQLNHITIDGTTSTPNFSLDISDHPVPLETKFHAFVDGTTGDTTLAPVEAMLLHSSFTAQGTIMNIHGQGHDIALTVNMPHGRIEDLLQLVMKTKPPVMRGAVAMQAKLHIPPGDARVTQKLQLSGGLRIQSVEFTSAKLQDRIDALSMRAQGKPKDVKAAGSDRKPEVSSDMAVNYSLANAMLLVRSLDYQVPGAKVNLVGVYLLNGSTFEFRGHVRTDATASQMVTGWKSTLLKPFDGMLKKNGAGTQIPIDISGANGNFKVGFAMHGADETPEQIEAEIKARRQAQRAPSY